MTNDDPHRLPDLPEGAGDALTSSRSPAGPAPRDSWADVAHVLEPEEEEGVNWSRYLCAILRYKWLVVLGLLLGGAAGAAIWSFMSPTYVAQGALWIQADASSDGRGPISSEGLLRSSAWVDLLNSYSVLDTVVLQQKLYLQPSKPGDIELFDTFQLAERFAPGTYELAVGEEGRTARLLRDGNTIDTGTPGDSIGDQLGFLWTLPSELPADRRVEFTVITPRDAALRLRRQLTTQMDREATFIRVEFPGKDPDRIARVLNAVMERHVELAADLKRGNLDERTHTLRRQLQQVEEELRTAERALENFRVETITLPSDRSTPIQPGLEMTRDPVFSNFFDMKVELETIDKQQERVDDFLRSEPDSGLSVEALQLIPAVQQSAELTGALDELLELRAQRRALLERYTPEHPPLQRLADAIRTLERETIPQLVRQLNAQLEEEKEVLEERIAAAGGDMSEIPPRTIEEARLRRRVAIAEQLYTELRSRYETASLAEASSIPDVRILDRAVVPDVPLNDQRIRMILLAILAGLGAGAVGAIVLDQADPRVRYPEELEKDLRLTILGAIPRIPATNGKKGRSAEEETAYEAFRELRTGIIYAYGSAGPLVLTISSPGKGDGKSLTTVNLGMAFANLGKRTLVIDGDTRRGDVHRSLGGRRKPGLTDILSRKVDRSEVLQSTTHEKLEFIASGSRSMDSPELLSSSHMGKVLAAAKERYDVILVDSPPLGAGTDAYVMASLTGHLLLVLRSGSTNKEFTEAKLETMHRLPVRILGAVLNDYQPQAIGHGAYYGDYLPGYRAGKEKAPEEDEERAPVPEPI